jgi:hypothetical protein
MQLPRACDRIADSANRGEMIFLDQVGVEQADPMIAAAAAQHSVFLCDAQLRNGLARIQDTAARMLDLINVGARLCRRAR